MNTNEYGTAAAEAIANAELAVHNRPNDFTAFEALGSVYFDADRLDEALLAYHQAIALNPNSASACEKIGQIYWKIGATEQAVAAFEQAITIDPHFLPSYNSLGWLYVSKLGDFQRAIESYERGLAANPTNPILTTYLGSTYARMGQTEKAVETIVPVVKDHPNLVLAHSWLSYLYFRLKRWDEAVATCHREIELHDAHSPHRVLGLIYLLQGQNTQAIPELERAVELEPHDYEARAALATLYRGSGNLTAAEYQYHTGMEMSLEDHEYGLACFHAVSGNFDQALALLETTDAKRQVSPGWLHIDPELVFVQDEPRFQALI